MDRRSKRTNDLESRLSEISIKTEKLRSVSKGGSKEHISEASTVSSRIRDKLGERSVSATASFGHDVSSASTLSESTDSEIRESDMFALDDSDDAIGPRKVNKSISQGGNSESLSFFAREKSISKSAHKTDSKTDSKNAYKTDSKSAHKTDSKNAYKTDSKSAHKTDSKSAHKT